MLTAERWRLPLSRRLPTVYQRRAPA